MGWEIEQWKSAENMEFLGVGIVWTTVLAPGFFAIKKIAETCLPWNMEERWVGRMDKWYVGWIELTIWCNAPKTKLGCIFFDKVFEHLSGKYPQTQRNIATTKLIQWKTAEMRGNKPFHAFGGFIFFAFWAFFLLRRLFRPQNLHLLLTIAGNR